MIPVILLCAWTLFLLVVSAICDHRRERMQVREIRSRGRVRTLTTEEAIVLVANGRSLEYPYSREEVIG